MKSENERIIHRKPLRKDSWYDRKRERGKPQMKPHEHSGNANQSEWNEPRAQPYQKVHHGKRQKPAHHVVRDVPKRTVHINRKEGERVHPREKSESGKHSDKPISAKSLHRKYSQKASEKRHPIRRSYPEESLYDELAGQRNRSSEEVRSPVLYPNEQSGEYEKEAHDYRKRFGELIEIPVPSCKVRGRTMLIQVVKNNTETGQCPKPTDSA